MACGDRYKYLIVTADGYTIDNKYGNFPLSSDYTGWLTRVDELIEMANDAYQQLGTIECQRTGGTNCGTSSVAGGSYPKWNALITLQNNIIAHRDNLEDDWHQVSGTQGLVEEINKAAQVAVEAVCLLDQANAGIQSYGNAPTVIPDITPTPQDEREPWWLWPLVGAGATLAVVAVGYGLIHKKRGGRREPPAASSRGEGPIARRPAGASNPRRPRKRKRKNPVLKAA